MQPRLEQLAHDAKRKVPLQLPTTSAQHRHPGALGQPPPLGQQPGLPNPGPPLDQRHPPLAADRRLDEAGELGQLPLALDQVGGRRHARLPRLARCLLPS